MAGRAEFKNWDSYWVILLENKTPLELKKSIIKLAPEKLILALEEILINIKVKAIFSVLRENIV